MGDTNQEFRLTKLDAFSGVRLLKLLSHADTDDLQDLILSLPEDDLKLPDEGLPAPPPRPAAGRARSGCWRGTTGASRIWNTMPGPA